MTKDKQVFMCNSCGHETSKWQGKCPACGEWNTMSEFTVYGGKATDNTTNILQGLTKPTSINEISVSDNIRYQTGMSEVDRVLGGGIVKGSIVLIAGDPGIGKSTLMLQICHNVAKGRKVLYVTGEESSSQIKLRSDRLGKTTDNLLIYQQTNLHRVLEAIDNVKPDLVVIDSIQTMNKDGVSSYPGSVTQVRECTIDIMAMSKYSETSVILIGHVNKEGALAGPKVLEHMVDAVIYFEGSQNMAYRVLRAAKNRFGSTNETGLFEMASSGLVQIDNPSAALLAGRPKNVSGMCAVCSMEGSRPMITEIQALVTQTIFNMPKRTSSGIDYNKLALLLAILEKRANVKLAQFDVYVNIVGGLKIDDPAADLSTILAIASNAKDAVIASDVIAIGETGLAGEVRVVPNIDARVFEATKLGFKTILVPKNSKIIGKFDGIEILYVKNILEAFALLF